MWNQAESSLGGKIEILCNNAGVPASVRFRDPGLLDLSHEVYQFQAGVEDNISIMSLGNTQGALFAVKKMKVSNGGSGGRIITTASVLGLQVGTQGWGTYASFSFNKKIPYFHSRICHLSESWIGARHFITWLRSCKVGKHFHDPLICYLFTQHGGGRSEELCFGTIFYRYNIGKVCHCSQRIFFHWYFKFPSFDLGRIWVLKEVKLHG